MSNTIQQVPDDQLTPRDVIDKVLLIKAALLKNWKLLLILPLVGFGIGYGIDSYLKKPAEFEAEVVFNLGGSQGPGLGDMAGLLGLGNAPDANIFTGENFFYFVKSRPVLELHNFKFKTSVVDSLDLDSRRILNELVVKARDATEIGSLERKSSFTKLETVMENERLAGMWVTTLLTTVEEMYTESQTQKTRKTLRLLESRRDSIGRILGIAEHQLAREMNISAQVFDPSVKVSANKIERKSSFLQQMYYEALASEEKMRVSLVREAPLFTQIEGIKVPLDMKMVDRTRSKIGALAGLFLALVFIYLKTVLTPAPIEVKS
jgi:uncharacterized membrane protein